MWLSQQICIRLINNCPIILRHYSSSKMNKIQMCHNILTKPYNIQRNKFLIITRNLSSKKNTHTLSQEQKNRLSKKITDLFIKHPILVNSFIYGTLYMAAEFSQQTINRKIMTNGKPTAYDPHMITRFGVLGGAVYPQIYYFWYKWLDRSFSGRTGIIIVKKLLLDQFVLTPPLLATFFIGMSILEGKDDIFDEFNQKFFTTFQTSCLFWLPVQTMNFMFIPPHFRIVYIATSAFMWVNILCYIKNLDLDSDKNEVKIKNSH
ncbi:mpv17-like protein isoform X2 [Chrysoperla carnea]|uniref:mpv17-like protein isoform X2 n=1 Tax=Chrysoperla carnea TaxID=189513 RepID=UPI001D0621B9|nr:mpv17-like protein isoform X2 [Chrysoperla carnea]